MKGPNLDEPRIAIVGSGAIGCYVGGCLAEAGHDVHFLMRSDYEEVSRKGMSVERQHKPSFRLDKVQCYTSTADIGPCDLVIVAIKSTSNEALKELIPPLLGANTIVLTLQNGLGNVEFLMDNFGDRRVLGATCFMGVNRIGSGSIVNYTPNGGAITVGEPFGPSTDRVKRIVALFEGAHISGKVSEDLQSAIWHKLVWNIPFNGLAVVTGFTTDLILKTPHLFSLSEALMQEVKLAASVQRIEISNTFITHQFEYTKDLGPYRPSTMIDYEAGRPVEVESIWGEAYRRGTSAGARMPCLGMLYSLVKSLASTKSGGRVR